MTLEGSDITVKGVVSELKIDNAYLDQKEAEVKKGGEHLEMHDGHGHGEGENEAEEEHSAEEEKEKSLKNIQNMRDKIEKSEKDHLSFYSIECVEFSEKK